MMRWCIEVLGVLPLREVIAPCVDGIRPESPLGFRCRDPGALRRAPEFGGQINRRRDPRERCGQVALAHKPRQLRKLRDVVQPQVRVVLGQSREEVGLESRDPVCEMGRDRGDFERHARADCKEQRGGSEFGERRREPTQRFGRVAVKPRGRERTQSSEVGEPFDRSDVVRREEKPGDGRESLSACVMVWVGGGRRQSVPMMRIQDRNNDGETYGLLLGFRFVPSFETTLCLEGFTRPLVFSLLAGFVMIIHANERREDALD
jgi:hypothetical protein